MKVFDRHTGDLPLVGGVVQPQRLVVPHEVIASITDYRHACRLAWKLKRVHMTKAQLADRAGLYASHVTDYFSVQPKKRELPAKSIGIVEAVLGNSVISQWVAYSGQLTVLEELQAVRTPARRAAA